MTTPEPGSAAMERTDFVKRLRAARANGDPEKYIAMITVWEAHAIADRIETLTRALQRIAWQKLTSEIGDDELVVNDIEGGYDACILEARAVVKSEGGK